MRRHGAYNGATTTTSAVKTNKFLPEREKERETDKMPPPPLHVVMMTTIYDQLAFKIFWKTTMTTPVEDEEEGSEATKPTDDLCLHLPLRQRSKDQFPLPTTV